MLDLYLDLLDFTYFEAGEAFKNLKDENVWRRPAVELPSIGDIACHIAYWQAVRFAGAGNAEGWPDLDRTLVSSPFVQPRFQYYTALLHLPPSNELTAMSAEDVWNELVRVHRQSVEILKSQNPDLDAPPPGWDLGGPGGNTLRDFLKYKIFHVSYHTGQIYTTRFLLGEQPPDN